MNEVCDDIFKQNQIMWPRDKTLMLCELLKENALLWNTSHPDYDNMKKREITCKEITAKLVKYIPGLEISDVRIKIHNLRSQYRKQLLSESERKQRGKGKIRNSWCLAALDFLRPVYTEQTNVSKFSNNLSRRELLQKRRTPYITKFDDETPVEVYCPQSAVKRAALASANSNKSTSVFSDKRFAWLGDEVVNTLKELQNETQKHEAMMAIQKLLKAAKSKNIDKQKHSEKVDTVETDEKTQTNKVHLESDKKLEQWTRRLKKIQSNADSQSFEWNYDLSLFEFEEITVKLMENMLVISASHVEHETMRGNTSRKFERISELPNGYDNNIIATISTDGMLTVRAVRQSMSDLADERYIRIQRIK